MYRISRSYLFIVSAFALILLFYHSASADFIAEDMQRCRDAGGVRIETYADGIDCILPESETCSGTIVEGQCMPAETTGVAHEGDSITNASGHSSAPASNYDSQVSQLEVDYEAACSPKKERAELCCGRPEQCVGEQVGIGGNAASLGMAFLQMLSGGAAASASVSQNCGKMKTVSYATAAINAAMAGTCTAAVGTCKSACNEVKARAEQLMATIPTSYGAHTDPTPYGAVHHSTGGDLRTRANRVLQDAKRDVNTCMTADNAAIRHSMQAIASTQAAKLSGLCQKATEAEENQDPGLDTIASNDFNVDCGAPGASANPICQQQCSRPGAESDPVCRAYLANLNGGPGFGSGFGNSGINTLNGDGLSFDVGDPLDGEQFADPGEFAPGNEGLATVQGTGSGLGGGVGAPGGGGGDGFAGGGAGGMLDFNSKILRGLSGGQGYSNKVSGRTTGGGGFSGYGNGRKPASKGKAFNLKDFLPGGKKAVPRGLAALGGGHPEIGAKSEDIFKRISNRFYAICMQDRLYDCDTLRKLRRPQ